jgi:LPS sulfotransferase NodH
MRWLDDRNGPEFDLPPPVGEGRTLVIASLPRTGSTLLGRLLAATGAVGDPKEYLNPMQVRDWQARIAPSAWTRLRHRALVGPLVPLAGRGRWTRARLGAHLDAIRLRRSAPDGWFGLKIHWHHFERWFVSTGWPVEDLLRPRAWVLLTREDRVAQAVSWHRALISGRWASEQRASFPAVYDRRAIQRRLDVIAAHETAWRAWFATRQITPLELRYEQVIADPQAAVRAVLTAIGVDAPPSSGALPMTRQADDTSAAWIERFRAGR